MSRLSGFDSEAIGFASISQNKRLGTSSSTQTNFEETASASQTNFSKDTGSLTNPEDMSVENDILKEYPPPGLNEFLRKVVPGMLEQLDLTDKELLYNSSDSEEEEVVTAKLFQELETKIDMPGLGAGDQQSSILGVSFSSDGNSLAVSVGQAQHENWCRHDGLIRVYTVKCSEQDKFVHSLDISEKNCVTVLKYHPSVANLLAYGMTSGEVVFCDFRSYFAGDDMQLSSPSGCHGSKRVSGLMWADAPLANVFLMMHISKTGRRRSVSDQILISAGSDGTINVWLVNANLKRFENVFCFYIYGSKKMPAPDISCFDFMKNCPLRPSEEKVAEHMFVVGSKSGQLYLCILLFEDESDPVSEVLEGHPTCVLDVAFSFQKPGLFASISMDSELRVYDVHQTSPLKVICLEFPISCMTWLPNNHCVVILGLANADKELVKVVNVSSGKPLAVDGLTGSGGSVTAIVVSQAGSCRIAAGDIDGRVMIWDLPSRRIKLAPEDLEF